MSLIAGTSSRPSSHLTNASTSPSTIASAFTASRSRSPSDSRRPRSDRRYRRDKRFRVALSRSSKLRGTPRSIRKTGRYRRSLMTASNSAAVNIGLATASEPITMSAMLQVWLDNCRSGTAVPPSSRASATALSKVRLVISSDSMPSALEAARRQLGHLAGPHQHRGFVCQRVEDFSRQAYRRRADRYRAMADQGCFADPLGYRQRPYGKRDGAPARRCPPRPPERRRS